MKLLKLFQSLQMGTSEGKKKSDFDARGCNLEKRGSFGTAIISEGDLGSKTLADSSGICVICQRLSTLYILAFNSRGRPGLSLCGADWQTVLF